VKALKIICILALILNLCTLALAQEVRRTGTIVDLEGNVLLKRFGSEDWVSVEIGTTVNEKDVIKTRSNSWAVLNIADDEGASSIEIKENSQLIVWELVKDEASGTQKTFLDLAIGKVMIKAQKLHTEESKFEVKTPTSIVGVRGTIFEVEVESLD